MKKIFVFLIVVIVCLILSTVQAQRGGGGRSRSSSRSSSSSFSFLSKRSGSQNGKKATKMSKAQKILILCGICAVSLYLLFDWLNKHLKRMSKIKQIMKIYESRMQQYPSEMNQEQKIAIIHSLTQNQYFMDIDVQGTREKYHCDVKVNKIKKQTQNKYRIDLSGNDQVGPSSFTGLIIFKENGFGIILSKVYSDRDKAGQTGEYDSLIYQGESNDDKVRGTWAFQGFKGRSNYSGTWVLNNKSLV